MINISDLSVGDWVEYEGLHYPITFVGYGEGGDGSLVDLIRPDLSCFICKISDIRPIPITAEILEKIGWRIIEKEALGEDYEYDGDERVWDNDNNKIDICEQKQGEFWHSYRSEYYLYRLYYVHQLQHLMRLYGVEEEIKFKVNLISTT